MLGILLVCSEPLFALETSFASTFDGKVYMTRLSGERFKDTTPASLYKVEEGKLVWAVAAAVNLDQASEIAIAEAKRLLGSNCGSEWTLRAAGRHVSGCGGRYFHHYHFEFRPKRAVAENLQVIVTLDGKIVQATRTR